MNGRDMAYKMLITFPDSTGPSAILKKRLFSPFVPIRSVETAVASDVWSLSVVGVEKEKNVGIQTRVHHNRDSGKSVENRAPGLGTPVNIVKINTIIIVTQQLLPRLWYDPLPHELDDHEGGVGDEEHDDHGEGEVGGLLLCPGHVAHLAVTRKIDANGSSSRCGLNLYSLKNIITGTNHPDETHQIVFLIHFPLSCALNPLSGFLELDQNVRVKGQHENLEFLILPELHTSIID